VSGRLLVVSSCAILVLVFASARSAPPAAADATPIAAGSATGNPSQQAELERLAGEIASHIAGRSVTVRCESADDWAALATGHSLDPNGEDGYVGSTWDEASGTLESLSTVAELDGATVCSPLSAFAAAAPKPTKCALPPALVRAAPGRPAGGSARRSLAATARARSPLPPAPCYLGGGRAVRSLPPSYWLTYERDAWAMLTLAHEAIHLSGVVGGVLADGTPVGDPQAEAKADCFGLQWVPYVADQLGDTVDDAQAIAEFIWDEIYPAIRTSDHSEYWSAQCAPGGQLDIRPAGATAWP